MTREDAINIMKVIVHMLEEKYDTDRVEDAVDMAIKALEQESCDSCVKRQEVLDILKDKWNNFSDANDAMQESIDTIEALPPATPLPQPYDLEGLKSDLKALNCGFPYGLDYLLDCLNRRLGITIIEADKAEGSDKE